MSKIHLALEKAEKERAEELMKKTFPAPVRDEGSRIDPGPAVPVVRFDTLKADESLVSLYQPRSLISEQFRKLRTQLLRLNLAKPVKTIMVTSALQGEGKSFVAANLAIGIAHDLHLHALLVDCDLRNPSVAPMFGYNGVQGIADYLKGQGEVSNFLVKTELEKLSLLPGGTLPENPTEMIGSQRMAALVQELKTRYDDRFIILDATPLLATAEPDVLAKLVDGVLIVVRAGMTPRETIKQALSFLDKDKILGVVLNDVNFKYSALGARYFGGDGYSYGYGYGYGKPQEPEKNFLRKFFGSKK